MGQQSTSMSRAGPAPHELPRIVLLVHRDPHTLEAFAAALESRGMWAATARALDEALDAAEDLEPDAVVVDARCWTTAETAPMVEGLAARAEMGARSVAVLAFDLTATTPIAADALVARIRQQLDPPHPPTRAVARRLPDIAAPPAASSSRTCPQCEKPLDWLERRPLNGVQYDYYRWCERGCGLYCYDLNASNWIKLA
jgi:hypothetical protein